MTPHRQHDVIRQAFTRQASTYPTVPSIVDPTRIARLVQAVNPMPSARVLEVATGPGYVALGFAEVCREVVGIDLTPALLDIAERTRAERQLTNVRFLTGDAERLPFADDEFDVVVCRFAFHHLPTPAKVLREMSRVCRPNGTVAVEDLVVSEHPDRAAYQNRFEQLRDPSHTRALPLGDLIRLFATSGLEVESVYTDALVPEVERWLATTATPPDRAADIRALLTQDATADFSGCRPFWRDGKLHFTQRTAAVIGRVLANTSVALAPSVPDDRQGKDP